MKSYPEAILKIGSYSLVIAGAISAIALCFHPDEFIPGSVLLTSWRPVHLALLFAFTISIFGIAGVFNSLNDQPKILGIIAYILGVIGCAGSAAVVVLEVFVLPTLAGQAVTQVPLMDMMGDATPFHMLGKFFMASVMIWIIAWVLIGVVLLRSTQYNRSVGILIILASVMIAIPTHVAGGLSTPLHIVFSLLFGFAWINLGLAILKQMVK